MDRARIIDISSTISFAHVPYSWRVGPPPPGHPDVTICVRAAAKARASQYRRFRGNWHRMTSYEALHPLHERTPAHPGSVVVAGSTWR
jgi:hypothetical protein